MVNRLNKLHFLIHGFCYACGWGGPPDDRNRGYFDRERLCAGRWFTRLGDLTTSEALAVIPAGREGQAADFYAAAEAALGDRFFMLDAPDPLTPAFWLGGADGREYARSLLAEIQAAFVHQGVAWNKEELHTALHSLACCRQFQTMLDARGLSFDPSAITAEAWGASFDGCVTKYSLNLRRMLGLSRAIAIDFDLSVPDASFLLEAELLDCVLLEDGLRLFLFNCQNRTVGLYTFTSHSLADAPANVFLPIDPDMVTVRSKQGIRLHPQPEAYILQNVPLGYAEPPQTVVRRHADGLLVPVSAGVVYRLAKAPSYVFMPAEMSYADARGLLVSARMGKGKDGDG